MPDEEQQKVANGLLSFMEEMQEGLKQELAPFWEIIEVVATIDPTWDDDGHDGVESVWCPYCDGSQTQYAKYREDRAFPHMPECIVMKARALMERKAKHNAR